MRRSWRCWRRWSRRARRCWRAASRTTPRWRRPRPAALWRAARRRRSCPRPRCCRPSSSAVRPARPNAFVRTYAEPRRAVRARHASTRNCASIIRLTWQRARIARRRCYALHVVGAPAWHLISGICARCSRVSSSLPAAHADCHAAPKACVGDSALPRHPYAGAPRALVTGGARARRHPARRAEAGGPGVAGRPLPRRGRAALCAPGGRLRRPAAPQCARPPAALPRPLPADAAREGCGAPMACMARGACVCVQRSAGEAAEGRASFRPKSPLSPQHAWVARVPAGLSPSASCAEAGAGLGQAARGNGRRSSWAATRATTAAHWGRPRSRTTARCGPSTLLRPRPSLLGAQQVQMSVQWWQWRGQGRQEGRPQPGWMTWWGTLVAARRAQRAAGT